MAKGIGGDDGPTLFMFVAIILIWRWLAGLANDAKKSVSETVTTIGNIPGPFQAQTMDEMETYQREVDSWPVAWSTLKPKTQAYYQNIASKIWSELRAFNVDEAKIIQMCKPFSAEELRAIAKMFGVKKERTFGFTVWTGHIFAAFEEVCENTIISDDLDQLKKIWAKSGLWP